MVAARIGCSDRAVHRFHRTARERAGTMVPPDQLARWRAQRDAAIAAELDRGRSASHIAVALGHSRSTVRRVRDRLTSIEKTQHPRSA